MMPLAAAYVRLMSAPALHTSRVPPSGLNSPLLALLADLGYIISIFVCRLVVTENISGGGIAPFASPGYAPVSISHALLH